MNAFAHPDASAPPIPFDRSGFDGRVFAITGGAHGIGESTARRLTAMGARVAIIDFDRENLDRVQADLQGSGREGLYVHGDLAKRSLPATVVRQMEKAWGRVDGWVNNAYLSPVGPLHDLPLQDFEKGWRVNVESVLNAAQCVVPLMKRAGTGSIVNVSSVLAHRTRAQMTTYAACKSAMEGMTRQFAVELAPHNIRVNTVIPGGINSGYLFPMMVRRLGKKKLTPRLCAILEEVAELSACAFQPMQKIGRPADVADVILFFLSDASRFVTGTSLPADGGFMVDGRLIDSDESVKRIVRYNELLAEAGFPYLSLRSGIERPKRQSKRRAAGTRAPRTTRKTPKRRAKTPQ